MAFLAPLAFIAALLAIPIILLYMLRLRRREVMISSTYLWQQILQDQEANTPWQRLRRNLLLILQLIILALMVFALARPFITVPAVSAGQTALLLDATASMNATDIDGESRFDEARRLALDAVNTLSQGNAVTVIRVGDVPEVLTPYTTDRDQLREAINNARPGTGQGDWLAALTLAAAGGANNEDFTILIIGDGGLDEREDLPPLTLPGEVRFLPVGRSSENVAISALATRALPGQPPQLFGQITNYSPNLAEVILTLRLDGQEAPVVSERFTIPGEGSLPIVSTQALAGGFSTLRADLTMSVNSQAENYLALDDTAWAVSRGTSERRVLLVTSGNLFLEQVLFSLPGLDVIRTTPDSPLPSQPFDLYVFDNTVPASLPVGDLFFINPPRSSPYFTTGVMTENLGAITVSDDERMVFVDFGSVSVLQARRVQDTGWARPLIQAEGVPLLLAGEADGRQLAVLTFDLRESNLPLQITWPILVANMLEWFTPSGVLTTSETLSIGSPVVINPPLDATAVRITAPDGSSRNLSIDRITLIYTETSQPGLYQIEVLNNDAVVQTQTFAVNAFLPSESDITPRTPAISGVIVVGEQSEPEIGQLEFWPLLALLALLVLVIEWYAYHRRMQMPTLLGRRGLRAAPARQS
jgi:Ca-activated chloride channel homolog